MARRCLLSSGPRVRILLGAQVVSYFSLLSPPLWSQQWSQSSGISRDEIARIWSNLDGLGPNRERHPSQALGQCHCDTVARVCRGSRYCGRRACRVCALRLMADSPWPSAQNDRFWSLVSCVRTLVGRLGRAVPADSTRSSAVPLGAGRDPVVAASSPVSPAPAPAARVHRARSPLRADLPLSLSVVVYGVAAMVVYARRSWPPPAWCAGIVAASGGLAWLVPQGAWCGLPGVAAYLGDPTRREPLSVFHGLRARRHGGELIGLYTLGEVVRSSAIPSHPSSRLTQIEGGLAGERAQLFVA
jgi:hypothetical protein